MLGRRGDCYRPETIALLRPGRSAPVRQNAPLPLIHDPSVETTNEDECP